MSVAFQPSYLSSRVNAKYSPEKTLIGYSFSSADPKPTEETKRSVWRPFVLTPWIPAGLCVVLILSGIILEIVYSVTVQRNGWPLPPDPTNQDTIHYVSTWIPVLFVMFIVTVFASADHFIMKMQPYVDLAKGSGASGETLLLDYTGKPKMIAWVLQIRGGHFLAALSTIVLLLMMALQPLASSLLVIKDTQIQRDPINVPKFGTVGLNESLTTLQGFASAAGFAEADSRYDIGRPPFVWQAWAVDEFQRPTTTISNGTMQASTTAIRTLPNCIPADQSSFENVTGGTQLTGSWQGCSVSLNFDNSADSFIGVDITRNCSSPDISGLDPRTKPVYFWFASPKATPPSASLIFCRPALSLHNVTITVNIANGNLIDVEANGNYTPTGVDFNSPPFNGQAFNGVEFNLTGASDDTKLRANLTQLQLPASVFEMLDNGGVSAALANSTFVANTTANRYQLFLALSARSNYFVTAADGSTLSVAITEIQQRLWMSAVATHAAAVIMIIGGILAGAVHFIHYRQRRNIRLYAPPGSIAVAASVTRDSPVNGLIQSGWDENHFRSALKGEKFVMDEAGKIVRIGEEQ